MSKKVKEIKVSNFQLDIIEWITLIISITCFIFCNKKELSSVLILPFAIGNILASACFIYTELSVIIGYKMKNKEKIPRGYFFEKDITSKDGLFKCHIMLIIATIILVTFSIIF